MPVNDEPEFGTVWGMQLPVNWSSSSPAGHWASTEALGPAKTEIAGGDSNRDREPAGEDQSF